MSEKPNATLPHVAVFVCVIKPKTWFVGVHNTIRDTLVHVGVDRVLDISVCCPVLLAVTKT